MGPAAPAQLEGDTSDREIIATGGPVGTPTGGTGFSGQSSSTMYVLSPAAVEALLPLSPSAHEPAARRCLLRHYAGSLVRIPRSDADPRYVLPCVLSQSSQSSLGLDRTLQSARGTHAPRIRSHSPLRCVETLSRGRNIVCVTPVAVPDALTSVDSGTLYLTLLVLSCEKDTADVHSLEA